VVTAALCAGFGQPQAPQGQRAERIEDRAFRLVETSVDEVHAAYKSGTLTAHALVQAYLDRIDAYDKKGPTINCIITINPRALAEADALDAAFKKSGTFVGSLHGIPILVKDEIDAAGMPTTQGTLVFKNSPIRDAFVVERLRKAGAIILGKTTLSEFAAGDTFGSMFGVTRNPYDLRRTVGGSSGGSGAHLPPTSPRSRSRRNGRLDSTTGRVECDCELTPDARPRQPERDGTVIPLHGADGTDGAFGARLGAAAGRNGRLRSRDPVTALGIGRAPDRYTTSLDPNGLKGARIGILRESIGGQSEPGSQDFRKVDVAFQKHVAELGAAGATVIDPVSIPDLAALLAKRASNPTWPTWRCSAIWLALLTRR
jgi:Asp-tRNA(Asn)/Glu-tRNA(Gln) amidotransferase A subunit family amidase